ncbi:heterodisulfide reductase-related iron-sulfur binding cluster [Desulfosporosinus nitroreducens]|uniref:heterodisulfide reductase-related iron-sulfur binding cluster n=1 Tax=Desulfosporosinus nitroreducens TaxID=2018668 RepID=UPI00207CC790|nr:heterodisulfide reductase-related iron-sulfur binding cluster [Desulfosporosinus nitroreducens]MCO1602557.1 heterodisulfide reductase-related iron-sulfur binding cluster [Desulfosporosinus nitroreducens]
MEATRQLYWNIDEKSTMYIFALIAFLIFIIGIIKKVRNWQQGRPIRYDNLLLRFKTFFSAVFKHDEDVFRAPYRRFMHLGIFYGFIILTFGTLVIAIQDQFGIPLFYGKKYLVLSLLLDLFGLMAMIGIVMAAYKRYIHIRDFENDTYDDAAVLILVFAILFSGFVLEGLRIYSTDDPWAWWSPVGLLFSGITGIIGLSARSASVVHAFLWYFHMFLTFGLIAYIPYSKLFHMLSSPLSIFLRSYSQIGALTPVDFPLTEFNNIGAGHLKEFSKKQLLELDACISCLRCQKGCPANMSGAPLTPRDVIQDLKKHAGKKNKDPIIDKVISRETLWSCTTCGLCEIKCPIYIEHVKRIVDMRRSLAAYDQGLPPEVQQVFNNISESGNPWGEPKESMVFNSSENSPVPVLSEEKETDILYWVGCFGSYESRNQKVSQAMFNILEKAGVNYAILGEEENCCGDSVRRLGNEKLFQHLAFKNVETLNRYKFKTILTHCPHCYNTLKNDYPQFGGHYQVVHHSEYLLELIKSEKISLKGSVNSTVTLHDPCYLGRYNSIYDAPREVLNSVPGLEMIEMRNNRTYAFCCGAGGGRVWLGDYGKKSVHGILVRKAMKTEADILASACSLCLTTLSGAISGHNGDMQSMDIAEIVNAAL